MVAMVRQQYVGDSIRVSGHVVFRAVIDISAFKNKNNGLALETSGANVKVAGAKIRSGGLAIQAKVMSIFS